MKYIFTFSLLNLLLISFGQNWTPIQQRNAKESCIKTYESKHFSFSGKSLMQKLPASGKKTIITIPFPDGRIASFEIKESEVLPQTLIQKYGIHAYKGYNTKNPKQRIRLEYNTENGFHAMITGTEETIYIDPLQQNDPNNISVYYRKDFVTQNKPKVSCSSHGPKLSTKEDYAYLRSARPLNSDNISIVNYRIAIAATKEYTNFHGGTVQKALSAITTTINRVSEVYEQEVAITFTLVANNDKIIFTNSNTGGLNNNNANTLINQSQTTIDSKIGSGNYDIGHTVSTGAGGLASLGVVCTSSKAKGVTGSPQPINDPYDVDYVCHEIGHQFGCEHTFNSSKSACGDGNRNQATAVEPGSGITIMGYAGICGADDLADNSIPYFHAISYDNITNFITTGSGKTCGTRTVTSNKNPEVVLNKTKHTLPKSTPFELTGTATDPNNDPLTYSWEQIDAGNVANSPNSPSGSSPLFRTYPPIDEPNRTFPKLNDILNGTSTFGEILPTYTRTLSFRLTARDKKGGVHYQEVTHNVDGNSGPFKLLSPNSSGTKTGNSVLTITWDVANTDKSPVNCASIDILLSTDGGQTFTQTLLSGTPNDGSASITLPNINTNKARIKLKAHDNIFFDINDANFTIQESTQPEFALTSSKKEINLCDNTTTTLNISSQSVNNFTGTINLAIENLPNGITASFASSSISENGNTTLNIKNENYSGNSFSIDIKGTSANITKVEAVNVSIQQFPASFSITSPTSNDVIGSDAIIKWNISDKAEKYSLSVDDDDDQSSPLISKATIFDNNYTASGLLPNTEYHVRVNAHNTCGTTPSTISFTTNNCKTYTQDTDINIIDLQTTSSTLFISDEGKINKVSLSNVQGLHDWVGDIKMTLIHPTAGSVQLFQAICDDDQHKDFNLGFSDDAPAGNIPCPPTSGALYRPLSPLSALNSASPKGGWKLSIKDDVSGDDGVLESWSLEVCYSPLDNIYETASGVTFQLYPNPAQNTLYIKGELSENNTVTITNVQGLVLINTTLNNNEINISRLAQGMYYVTIGNSTFSFVKE